MSASASSIDASSKRWLALLALVFLASASFLAYSFIKAMSSPNDDGVTTQQPARESAGEATARSEPAWSFPQEARAIEDNRTSTPTSPFNSNVSTVSENNEAAREEMVQKQAQSLRAMVKQNKVPEGLGNLTLDRIDEMAKKGIVIE